MTEIDVLKAELEQHPKRWVVTGAAGFIGSNLIEELIGLGQSVVGLDDLSTGHLENIDDVRAVTGAGREFEFIRGDICDFDICAEAFEGADVVLHQAALGSVPRSIKDPIASNRANVDGFLNVLLAARDAGVRRVVYAASSAVYGDHPGLPKVEDRIGSPLSPYAVTKLANELYADVFGRTYGMEIIGLRYFNVFGPRQDPLGAYAAVIPRWVGNLLSGTPCVINGDGETSRDFCYVANVVQANLLAACVPDPASINQVYNIAVGERTTLNELFRIIRDGLAAYDSRIGGVEATHAEFREGDVRHSLADISKAQRLLGYAPTHTVESGMAETLRWYSERAATRGTFLSPR